jgi:MFS family permease/quinol monooxygenase YgiN
VTGGAVQAAEERPEAHQSAWAPLRYGLFRRLWTAQLASNVGTWMQNVGAVWLMGSLTGSPALVALVQTATTLPIFLFGLPAGALADIVDRRRLLLVTQTWMLLCATALGVLAAVDLVTPAVLLILTFAIGTGVALNQPAWQAIQPELVPRQDFAQAVALGGVSINVGRAAGPAIGGAIVAAAGPEYVFLANAASFLGVLAVLLTWRREPRSTPLPAEHVVGAVRAGLRYARHAPSLRAVLVRTGLFIIPASAITALLPVVARSELGLGAEGYGLLLTAFGGGAVLAAAVLPRLRAREPLDLIVAGSSVVLGVVVLGVALLSSSGVIAAVLVVGGLAWLLAISSLNVSVQYSLPGWVRARGLAVYLLLFGGGTAAGSALWGVLADLVGTTIALSAAAAALAVGAAGAVRYRLGISERLDLRPSLHWPEPTVVADLRPGQGAVLVTVEYRVRPDSAEEFAALMRRIERMRRRTGAAVWGLYQDSSDPGRFVENFVVESWDEHLRQHARVTESDRRLEQQRNALLVAGTSPRVRHHISAYGHSGDVDVLNAPMPASDELADE